MHSYRGAFALKHLLAFMHTAHCEDGGTKKKIYTVYRMCTYTGWPRKNATILIRNFNDILD